MRFKSFALGGAAFVGLIGVTLSVPAAAYTHHPSTPVERQQTDDLNGQALAKAQSSGQQTAQTAGAATQETAQAPSTVPKTAMVGGAAQPGSARVSLDAVANSSQTLANASVETNDGQAVGAVQKVVTDGSGKPQTVDVALLGSQSKTVAIDATELSYDQQRNVVVAQLTADQIQALPPTPQG